MPDEEADADSDVLEDEDYEEEAEQEKENENLETSAPDIPVNTNRARPQGPSMPATPRNTLGVSSPTAGPGRAVSRNSSVSSLKRAASNAQNALENEDEPPLKRKKPTSTEAMTEAVLIVGHALEQIAANPEKEVALLKPTASWSERISWQ